MYTRDHIYSDERENRKFLQTPEEITAWLEEFSHKIDFPEIWLSGGDEMNVFTRDWDSSTFKICLVSTMPYTAAVGNLAVPNIYGEIMELGPKDWLVDRAYFWDTRPNYNLSVKYRVPVFGYGTRRPLGDFDFLAFSVSYLQMLSHMGTMLDVSGLPFIAAERSESDPFVLVGGHQLYANTEMAWEVPDAKFIGEFSAGGLKFITHYSEKSDHIPKKEWLHSYLNGAITGTSEDGIYVPSFYEEEYYDEYPYPIKSKIPIFDDIPERIKKVYATHLDSESFVATRKIVPFVNTGMGGAELQSSFGCNHGTCSFCSEGQTNKPYRYFSVETMLKNAKEMMLWTGSPDLTISAFDGMGHPQSSILLRRLFSEVSERIGLLSLRVTEAAENPDFVAISTSYGNTTISLGVEGTSQRMRRIFQKNCTEEALLKVCRNAMEHNVRKIKFYLIANHPWETEDDRQEWLGTLRKIIAIRKELGVKTQLISSWTPLFIVPFTPLQWEYVNPLKRSLNGILPTIKEEMPEVTIRIGSAGRVDEAQVFQWFMFGDRRLATLYRYMVESGYVHFTSAPRGSAERFKEVIKSVKGPWTLKGEILDYGVWVRPRDYKEILPWDILDLNVSKGWLKMVNEISKRSRLEVPGCTTACTACGACTDLDRTILDSSRELGDLPIDGKPVLRIRERGRQSTIRLKYKTDRQHRHVTSSYWMRGFARALRYKGLVQDTQKAYAVRGAILYDKVIYGVDYADVGILPTDIPDDEILDCFNAYYPYDGKEHPILPAGLRVLEAKILPPSVNASRADLAVHYVVPLTTKFTADDLNSIAERFLGSTEYIVKVPTSVGKAIVKMIERDVRPDIVDLWVQPNGVLHLLMKRKLNPVNFLTPLLGMWRSHARRLEIMSLNVYPVKQPVPDLVTPVSKLSGDPLPLDMFGDYPSFGMTLKEYYTAMPLDIKDLGSIRITDTPSDIGSLQRRVTADYEFNQMMENELNALGVWSDGD